MNDPLAAAVTLDEQIAAIADHDLEQMTGESVGDDRVESNSGHGFDNAFDNAFDNTP